MTNDATIMKIRAKKLGNYISEARIAGGHSIAELSEKIGISSETMGEYENGNQSPSLPELELLAYTLQKPLEYFIEGDTHVPEGARPIVLDRFLGIRQRIIGTQLRKARVEAKLTLEDISRKTGIDADKLHTYEMGDVAIPLPELDALVSALNVSIRDFQDKHGPVGEWLIEQQQVNAFLELSDDIRAFISKPVNVPYLELAVRLSEMSVEKLRSVAEGLLEITL